MSEEEERKLREIADRDEAIERLKAQAALKTLKQFLRERDEVTEIYVPFPIDARFRVKLPRMQDYLQIADKEGKEYDRALLFMLLHGADESVTEEMIGELSDEEVTVFVGATSFLFQRKPSEAAPPSNAST